MRKRYLLLLGLCWSFVGFSEAIDAEHEQEIAKALQFYFEEVGRFDEQGNYEIFDLKRVQQLAKEGDALAARVYEIYVYEGAGMHPDNAVDFAKCVAGKFADSYGGIARAFLKGEIFDLLKNKNWKRASELMFKVLKAAGRSASAASLAVEAGIYGWQCRSKW